MITSYVFTSETVRIMRKKKGRLLQIYIFSYMYTFTCTYADMRALLLIVPTRVVESKSLKVGKSLKIGKNRIKSEKSEFIFY